MVFCKFNLAHPDVNCFDFHWTWPVQIWLFSPGPENIWPLISQTLWHKIWVPVPDKKYKMLLFEPRYEMGNPFLVFAASADGPERKTTFAQESSVKEVDSKSLSCQRYKLNIYRRNILSYYGFKQKTKQTGNWFIEHFKVNICKEEIYWTFFIPL